MGNLSQFVPEESETVKRIYAWHKARGDAEPNRGYLGASVIGHECDRYLWYGFRRCVKRDFSGRMYRLFETGDLEEARFVNELRGIGCTVHDVDPDTGKQFEVQALAGHVSGHMDGSGLDIPEAPKTWHVLEFKTHNAKSFAKLKKDGVASTKPLHHAQVQTYMGLTGMTRALYLARNKDTDELYSERVRFDPTEFKRLMERARRIIETHEPPARMTNRSDDYRCKFCGVHALCWGMGAVAVPLPCKTCRTCCHATPDTENGGWSCARGGIDTICDSVIRADRQPGCRRHLLLPGLVSFAAPTDAGDDWIEFQNPADSAVWRHGDGTDGTWTTEELMRTPGPLVGAKPVANAKRQFEGSALAADMPLSLVERYPTEDSRLRWEGSPNENDAIFDFLSNTIGLDVNTITAHETDETHDAYEFEGRVLLVIYLGHDYAAIWEGVE